MRIRTLPHVFSKISGVFELSNIVEKRHDPGQQGIGLDRVCRRLGNGGNIHAMLKSARRLLLQTAQQWMIRIIEFEKCR